MPTFAGYRGRATRVMDAGGDRHSHWCPTRRERRVTYGRSCVLDPFLLEEDDPHLVVKGSPVWPARNGRFFANP